MKGIILDTSFENALFLIIENEKIIYQKKILRKFSMSVHLFSEVFAQKELLKDLDFVACSQGPGSFTGLRIGGAICKSLSYAKKIPIISYCPLAAITSPSAYNGGQHGVFIHTDNTCRHHKNEQAQKIFSNFSCIYTPSPSLLQEKFSDISFIQKELDPEILASIVSLKFKNKEYTQNGQFTFSYFS